MGYNGRAAPESTSQEHAENGASGGPLRISEGEEGEETTTYGARTDNEGETDTEQQRRPRKRNSGLQPYDELPRNHQQPQSHPLPYGTATANNGTDYDIILNDPLPPHSDNETLDTGYWPSGNESSVPTRAFSRNLEQSNDEIGSRSTWRRNRTNRATADSTTPKGTQKARTSLSYPFDEDGQQHLRRRGQQENQDTANEHLEEEDEQDDASASQHDPSVVLDDSAPPTNSDNRLGNNSNHTDNNNNNNNYEEEEEEEEKENREDYTTGLSAYFARKNPSTDRLQKNDSTLAVRWPHRKDRTDTPIPVTSSLREELRSRVAESDEEPGSISAPARRKDSRDKKSKNRAETPSVALGPSSVEADDLDEDEEDDFYVEESASENESYRQVSRPPTSILQGERLIHLDEDQQSLPPPPPRIEGPRHEAPQSSPIQQQLQKRVLSTVGRPNEVSQNIDAQRNHDDFGDTDDDSPGLPPRLSDGPRQGSTGLNHLGSEARSRTSDIRSNDNWRHLRRERSFLRELDVIDEDSQALDLAHPRFSSTVSSESGEDRTPLGMSHSTRFMSSSTGHSIMSSRSQTMAVLNEISEPEVSDSSSNSSMQLEAPHHEDSDLTTPRTNRHRGLMSNNTANGELGAVVTPIVSPSASASTYADSDDDRDPTRFPRQPIPTRNLQIEDEMDSFSAGSLYTTPSIARSTIPERNHSNNDGSSTPASNLFNRSVRPSSTQSAAFLVTDQAVRDATNRIGLYTGTVSSTSGLPTGEGTMIYHDNGDRYEGHWQDGYHHGTGRRTTAGHVYDGDFVRHVCQGQGTLQYTSNASTRHTYSGAFENNKSHGQGVLQYKDGSVYEGLFSKGRCDGHGRIVLGDGSTYVGDWLNGMFWGQGKWTWPDGRSYEGGFERNERHGYGREINEDGTVKHDGLFRRNRAVHADDAGGSNDGTEISMSSGDDNEQYDMESVVVGETDAASMA